MSTTYVSFFANAENPAVLVNMRDREAMLAAVVLHTPECVKIITADGTLLDMNSAGLALIEADDWSSVKGANVYDLMAPEHLEAYRQFNQRVCAGNKESLEFEIIALRGTRRWMQTTAVPLTLPSGEIVHLAITRDMTADKLRQIELNREKERAEAASIAKSEFLANMSHEIRTPMAAILGFTETLSEQIESVEGKESCEIIRRNGEHLLNIINDILDLSKIESGKLEVEFVRFNLHGLLSDLQQLLKVRADAKGLHWQVAMATDVPQYIVSDPTRIRQVILNLVGNAMKFTEVGSVELTCRANPVSVTEVELQFCVRDSGIGIAPQQVEHVFTPFVQADTSMTRRFGGSGLGLAISRRLAGILGGELICTSELGVGSEFLFTARARQVVAQYQCSPRKCPPTHSHGEPVSTNPNSTDHATNAVCRMDERPLKGLRILLVEDGPDNQRLISFLLKKAGADVAVEDNGQKGYLHALSTSEVGNPFDVILMDMQMPVMDGYVATKKLRQSGYAGAIVALTAHAMSGDRAKCLEAGCDDYLTKPIDRSALYEISRRLAERSVVQ